MIANREAINVKGKAPKRINLMEMIFVGNFQLWDKIMNGAKFDPFRRDKKVAEEGQKNN